MFDQFIAVDWSGAGKDEQRADGLRVAFGDLSGARELVTPPEGRSTARNWKRRELGDWLTERLSPGEPVTFVALDFGFSLPFGADEAIFGVKGWRSFVREVSRLYEEHGTAQQTAQAINAKPKFKGSGPYRFDDSRTDFRFYLDHGICYYRAVELVVPQAIGQWYMGSGATVAYHTLAGIPTLNRLLEARDAGVVDFQIWPQETMRPVGPHAMAECYPAIFRDPESVENLDGHDRDVLRVLRWLQSAEPEQLFHIPEVAFGRVDGVTLEEQIAFEGWILGVQ